MIIHRKPPLFALCLYKPYVYPRRSAPELICVVLFWMRWLCSCLVCMRWRLSCLVFVCYLGSGNLYIEVYNAALLALTCGMAPLRVCAGSTVWCMGNVDPIASVVGFASLTPQAVDSIELLAAPECLWSTLRWSRSVDWDPRVSSSRSWTSGSLDATEAERSRKEPTNKTWSCYNRLNCLLQLQWKMQ